MNATFFFIVLINVNAQMMYAIFTKYRNLIAFICAAVQIFGAFHLVYGYQNFRKHASDIIFGSISCFSGLTFYLYISAALSNVNMDQTANLNKIVQESKITKIYQ